MLSIDASGTIFHPRIKLALHPQLERGAMPRIAGIIVHQTDSSTAASTLASYKLSPNGAHFLIDKDGTIYQTVSVMKRVNHVGKLRARCVAEHSCEPAEFVQINRMKPLIRNRHEMKKSVPTRYPSNLDSIGIEIVGRAKPPPSGKGEVIYETVTTAQNASLAWLVGEISKTLKINLREIFRHPTVSQKNVTEASTARW